MQKGVLGCGNRSNAGMDTITLIHEQLLGPNPEEEHGSIAANPAAIDYPCRS
jgi:hypothetical protein